MKKEDAQKLLEKYSLGRCTKRESEIIDLWYQSLGKEQTPLSENDELSRLGMRMLENINYKTEKKEGIKKPQ